MRNIDTGIAPASNWVSLKRAISAAVFTTALAIIPAAMAPSAAMADDFVEYFPAVQLVVASSGSADQAAELAAEVLPESLVYLADNLPQTTYSRFTADDQSASWGRSANDDWQVSVSLLKTGTLATPTRWAMVRYTRPIW